MIVTEEEQELIDKLRKWVIKPEEQYYGVGDAVRLTCKRGSYEAGTILIIKGSYQQLYCDIDSQPQPNTSYHFSSYSVEGPKGSLAWVHNHEIELIERMSFAPKP